MGLQIERVWLRRYANCRLALPSPVTQSTCSIEKIMRHPARPTHVGLDHARLAKLVLELWDEAVHDAQKAHEIDNGNQQYADQVRGSAPSVAC